MANATCYQPEGDADNANGKESEEHQNGPMRWWPAPSGLVHTLDSLIFKFANFSTACDVYFVLPFSGFLRLC